MTCLGEPIDDVLIDHTMVLLLCANSERIGAGKCKLRAHRCGQMPVPEP